MQNKFWPYPNVISCLLPMLLLSAAGAMDLYNSTSTAEHKNRTKGRGDGSLGQLLHCTQQRIPVPWTDETTEKNLLTPATLFSQVMLGVGRRDKSGGGGGKRWAHTAIKKNRRGRGKKAHLTDMLRDVWTRTGLAQNHTSLLGVVEVKAVLQLKAYQSLVCVCSTELQRNKRQELKNDSNRLSKGREEQIWAEGRA